eukprot:COSAG01_NODE_4718_length_4794_cov_363.209585_7_plen_222_part_00
MPKTRLLPANFQPRFVGGKANVQNTACLEQPCSVHACCCACLRVLDIGFAPVTQLRFCDAHASTAAYRRPRVPRPVPVRVGLLSTTSSSSSEQPAASSNCISSQAPHCAVPPTRKTQAYSTAAVTPFVTLPHTSLTSPLYAVSCPGVTWCQCAFTQMKTRERRRSACVAELDCKHMETSMLGGGTACRYRVSTALSALLTCVVCLPAHLSCTRVQRKLSLT